MNICFPEISLRVLFVGLNIKTTNAVTLVMKITDSGKKWKIGQDGGVGIIKKGQVAVRLFILSITVILIDIAEIAV